MRARVPVKVMLTGDVFVNSEAGERIAIPVEGVATWSTVLLVESGVMSLLRGDDQELRKSSALPWSALNIIGEALVSYLIQLFAGLLQLGQLFIDHAPELPITNSISCPDNSIRKSAVLCLVQLQPLNHHAAEILYHFDELFCFRPWLAVVGRFLGNEKRFGRKTQPQPQWK